MLASYKILLMAGPTTAGSGPWRPTIRAEATAANDDSGLSCQNRPKPDTGTFETLSFLDPADVPSFCFGWLHQILGDDPGIRFWG